MITFTAKDLTTDKYPDIEHIALTEPWADGLIYCDMEGFRIDENGYLYLMDECGNYRYCPTDRFEITVEDEDIGFKHSYIY